jgi:hypothetical protein
MQEKDNVLRILEETKDAIAKEDVGKLKELSDQTIHTASISQDPDNVAIAVIVYSISKIIERSSYKSQVGWDKFYKGLIMGINNSIDALNKDDDTHLSNHIEGIRKKIDGLSGNLKKYIQDVFLKASINKASKIYEHGISMEKTAKLLGISLWELAGYAGQKDMDGQDFGRTLNAKQRIKLAMEMFE